MKREFYFNLAGKVFKADENMIFKGHMHVHGNYSEFKELIVHGDCIVDEVIKAEKLVVHGNLIAKSAIVNELEVTGDVSVSKISIYDMKVGGNFISAYMKAHHSELIVGGKVKVQCISGEIHNISVGNET